MSDIIISEPETINVVKMLLDKFECNNLSKKVTHDKLNMFIKYLRYKAEKQNKHLDEVNFWL